MRKTDVKNKNGITLIALIITIILMLILAGVVLTLTIGKNGLFKTAKYATQKNSEVTAREKLELTLGDLQAHKYTNEAYNENEYIDSYLKNEGMQVVEDVVTVNGWKFTIDRSVPQIGESLGQEEIRVTKIVREYSGRDENGKYIVQVTVIVESDKEIKSIVFKDLDGIEVIPTGEKYKIAKDITIELDKEYKIVVNTTDGKNEEKTIIEKLPELGVLISTPYVGTSSFTTKVQYVTNEEDIESYTYMLNEDEIATNMVSKYTLEDRLEPETTYNVKVIAKYKNGLTIESNVVTIKTEPRTYLYNKGDTCDSLTGGWKAEAVGNEDQWGTIFVKPILNTKANSNHMNAYILGNLNATGGRIMPVNKIDYLQYKKIGIIYTANLGTYNGADEIRMCLTDIQGNIKTIVNLCYPKPVATKTTIKSNIPTMKNIDNINIYLQVMGDSSKTNIDIYEMWLEK